MVLDGEIGTVSNVKTITNVWFEQSGAKHHVTGGKPAESERLVVMVLCRKLLLPLHRPEISAQQKKADSISVAKWWGQVVGGVRRRLCCAVFHCDQG